MGLTSLWSHIYMIFRFHGWCPNHLQDVQFTVETPNHSEKAEIEYLWNIQMTAATNWTSGCKVSCTSLTNAANSVDTCPMRLAINWILQMWSHRHYDGELDTSQRRIGHIKLHPWNLKIRQMWSHKLVSPIDYVITQSLKSQTMT